jgi:hypothetical protein
MKFQLVPVLAEYSRITGGILSVAVLVVVSTGLPVDVVRVPVMVVFPPVSLTIAGVSWAVIKGWSGYFTEYTRTYEEEEAKSWTK